MRSAIKQRPTWQLLKQQNKKHQHLFQLWSKNTPINSDKTQTRINSTIFSLLLVKDADPGSSITLPSSFSRLPIELGNLTADIWIVVLFATRFPLPAPFFWLHLTSAVTYLPLGNRTSGNMVLECSKSIYNILTQRIPTESQTIENMNYKQGDNKTLHTTI